MTVFNTQLIGFARTRFASRIRVIAAQLLFVVATALIFGATTPSVAFAQQSAGEQAQIAKMILAAMKQPIAASPKSWEWQSQGEWQEVCYEVYYSGNPEWGYTQCDWNWVEVYVLVWVPDPEECPVSAPIEDLKSLTGASSRSALKAILNNPGDKLELAPNRSYRANPKHRSQLARQQLGDGWYSTWDRTITISQSGHMAQVTRGDGSEFVFMKSKDGTWEATPRVANTFLFESPGSGWLLVEPGSVENYDTSGRLRRLTSRLGFGGSFQLDYTADGMLESVVDFRGNTLRFAYINGYVSTVTGPDGGLTTFSHQGGRLTAAYYPNGEWREFSYDPSGRASYILHGKGSKSLKAGRGALRSGLGPDIGNGPGATLGQEASQSCPVPTPPCEDWMRREIAQCAYEALQRKIDNDFQYCDPILNALYNTNDIDEITRITANYYACKANNEARYWSDIAQCTSRYPQCS